MDDITTYFTEELQGARGTRTRKVNVERIEHLTRELLIALGEDPQEEGLRETPRRVAAWWREFIEYDPGTTETLFESTGSGQLVLVKDMRVWSMCEHHMMPFWCDVAIGYLATDRVLGLSKFARIAHQFAHRLQLQERLGEQIADEVMRITQTEDVGVVISGEHLCMSARGIRTPGTMKNFVTHGAFQTSEVQEQFFRLLSFRK